MRPTAFDKVKEPTAEKEHRPYLEVSWWTKSTFRFGQHGGKVHTGERETFHQKRVESDIEGSREMQKLDPQHCYDVDLTRWTWEHGKYHPESLIVSESEFTKADMVEARKAMRAFTAQVKQRSTSLRAAKEKAK